MSRSTQAAEFNTFVGGLITEATPLTFPANASLDEDNFVLNRKGSRQRRLGMDLEAGAQEIVTSISPQADFEAPVTTYHWKNAGGTPDKDLVVVQVANELKFFDQSFQPLSSGLIHTYLMPEATSKNRFSYAVVDGILLIAAGIKEVYIFQYIAAGPSMISVSQTNLKIRDLFGVEDVVNGVDLRSGNNITVRPTSGQLTEPHTYNLRNQTFAISRKPESLEYAQDPIASFSNFSAFPSNSDNLNLALYADANNTNDRLTERFIARDLFFNPPGTLPAPRGYFIIDALARGTSRLDEVVKLQTRYGHFARVNSLPVDTTPGGPSALCEYAGRAWFAGFSGELVGGDRHSPRMASYVLFSQVVEDPTDIANCYQAGDPTSKEDADLVDTDGGFIRLDGAYGISKLVTVGNALMAIAANGVWMITGGSDYGFKATNYMVTKLSDRSCQSPNSIVVIDNSFLFWADDGIYSVAPNQFGDYEAVNITRQNIQTFYDNISDIDRKTAFGVHDTYEQKVRWVFNNKLDGGGEVRELVLDVTLGSFYTNSIKNLGLAKRPMVAACFTVPPFIFIDVSDPVTVNGEPAFVNNNLVTVTTTSQEQGFREVFYLAIIRTTPTITYSFSYYRDDEYRDWKSLDGVGADAKAFLLTGYQSGGDHQRYKQVPYITFHFNKTENGFELDSDGDFIPTNPSGCLVSAQWDWANSANSGQWGRKFQAYRFKRHYIPADINDTFDNGYATVVTKNKLRGKGKVLSMLIETEPFKDCQLLGWSMILTANGNV